PAGTHHGRGVSDGSFRIYGSAEPGEVVGRSAGVRYGQSERRAGRRAATLSNRPIYLRLIRRSPEFGEVVPYEERLSV
ncbi:MAG TPA: hypothetical protein VFJ20_03345, partial [Gemmatimonadaceae bacterium]|nr:hypothetical protein [Gemmatimonadaceae bacterium]